MKEEATQFRLRFTSTEDHLNLKVAAAKLNKRMNDFILEAIREKIASLNSRRSGGTHASSRSK